MIERSPVFDFVSHVVLLLGVRRRRLPGLPDLRRLDADAAGDQSRRRCRSLPGTQHDRDLPAGAVRRRDQLRRHGCRRWAHMMWVSLVTRARHRDRQDRDLAALGVRDRLLPLPVPDRWCFWMIFVTLMLPVEVRICPDLQGGRRPRHAQQLRRPDDPADRLGDGDLPVPPVLPDRARRARRGGTHRRRRARCASSRTCCCRCRRPRSPRSS